MRKLFVCFVVVSGLIIKSGYIESGRKSIIDHSPYLIHSAGYGACRVKTAHEARGQEYKVGRKQFVAQMRMNELKALGEWFQKEQEDPGAEPGTQDSRESGKKKEA